jgi:putative tricarboxylic transport membrane protein
MRRAQILMALGFIAFSIAVMGQALYVGASWVEGQAGPGFFPFWLSVLLFLFSAITLGRVLFAEKAALQAFFDDHTGMMSVVKITATAAGMLVLTWIIGFQVASIAYLFVYLRFIGKHRWPAVIAMSLLIPVTGYVVFERILEILLPRGIIEVPFFG